MRQRHDRDGRGARSIERAQVREQIGGGLDEVAGVESDSARDYFPGSLMAALAAATTSDGVV